MTMTDLTPEHLRELRRLRDTATPGLRLTPEKYEQLAGLTEAVENGTARFITYEADLAARAFREIERLREALKDAESSRPNPTGAPIQGVNMQTAMSGHQYDTTHAQGCWGWGPRHYECAVGQIERDETLLRQALKALKAADWYIGQLELFVYSPDDDGTHENRAEVQSAIAALRERLGEKV